MLFPSCIAELQSALIDHIYRKNVEVFIGQKAMWVFSHELCGLSMNLTNHIRLMSI